jgi:hypothetical protein
MQPDSLRIATEAYYWKPAKALFGALRWSNMHAQGSALPTRSWTSVVAMGPLVRCCDHEACWTPFWKQPIFRSSRSAMIIPHGKPPGLTSLHSIQYRCLPS